MKNLVPVLLLIGLISCQPKTNPNEVLNLIAEDYVKLVLEAGLYDPYFVDAYYGPEEWKPENLTNVNVGIPSENLLIKVRNLNNKLKAIDQNKLNEDLILRHRYLVKQLIAVQGRIELLSGKKFSFDEETSVLYDVVTPNYKVEDFESVIQKLNELLPGKGDLNERLNEFKKDFIIPNDKLEEVFNVAIAEARRKTLKYIDLPENENFVLEFVSDKPWGGYNWYKGNNFSLIQINTDLPVYIDRAIDLAAHEGYPGHHVYNCLLESNMVKKNKWMEFSVYPLYSPQSLIAEGTANFGIEMAFPYDEKIKFEKEILFPLAGLDPEKVEKYYEVLSLVSKVSYVRNAAAEAYLNSEKSKEETIEWLVKYALRNRESAKKSLSFIEAYRSYIINYNVGLDMVRNYMESNSENMDEKWERFEYLISTPQVPSNLVE
ncbi:MAG: hypothetical protein PF485_05370 [Bacteroidales bacterium]|jgi:hypothetical protein|nr:hypothetical protein [Bacteroidales bacterium]